MKTILLAAAAILAMPAFAQTTGGAGQASTPTDQGTSTAPPAGSTNSGTADQQATPPADGSGTAMSGSAASGQPMSTGGDATQGGMQGGAMAGGMASGTAPAMAEPAPAPLDHYPVCKKGQYDKCIEAGSSNGGTHHAMHRRRHK
jgi:hypothetical protein